MANVRQNSPPTRYMFDDADVVVAVPAADPVVAIFYLSLMLSVAVAAVDADDEEDDVNEERGTSSGMRHES